jgi:FixJ family two-component response regulator
MTGLELRRCLLAKRSTIPVVFITAHDDEATRAEALGLGCVDYLLKPFDTDQLIEAVRRAISGS